MINMKKYDVTALGELLIDFTDNCISAQKNMTFEANPGGAPCNVLSMLSGLGNRTAFIGKVGDDFFGHMLRERIESRNIDTSGLFLSASVPTTLAFVRKLPDGDRDFAFFRNPGADMMLTADEVMSVRHLIESSRIFHFGTLSMTSDPAVTATKTAVDAATGVKALISFDPNYRAPLWSSPDTALKAMEYGFSVCDVLKISDDEIEFFCGTTDVEKGARMLAEKYDIPLVLATMGAGGSMALYGALTVFCPGFRNPDTCEITGAGDTFFACVLDFLLKHDIGSLTENDLSECLTFANAAASIITTRKGALAVMPEKGEVMDFLKSHAGM